MKNEVLKGSIILIFAGIVGKLLGALYRIPLSNILGAEGIGLYQMIFPLFTLALIICSSGVSATLSHLIAKARAEKKGNIRSIFLKGFFYSLICSLIFSLLFYIFSEQTATLQGNVLASSGYKMMIFALIFSSLLAPFRGYFQGHQNMLPTAISQILEQFFKFVLGLTFAFIFSNHSVELGVVGAFLGISISEVIAFFYLLIKYITFKTLKFENKRTPFIGLNFTYTASYLIIPLILAFDSFVVINLLNINFTEQFSTIMYGIQSGIVNSLINFPVIISVAISLSLLPSLTFLIITNKKIEASKKLKEVFNIIWIIVLPCIVVFIIFSSTIMGFLYSEIEPVLLVIASNLLQISAPQILFICVLQISVAIFQSLGNEKMPVFIMLFGAIIKIVLTISLVRIAEVNIYGVALANLIFYAVSAVVSLFIIKKTISFSLDKKCLIITFSSAVIMSVVFYFINVFILNIWTKLSLIALLGMILYIAPIILFKVVDITKFLKKGNDK
ncbi:MAG: polysaccharide biosynthesis protein [Clostridia bacterium]|nr:polysaccharide biosynthesis protein [Clostridia bacterium]